MKGNKSLKKHVLVIAQYFYPEEFRINDICAEWVERGYKVTVLTGIPNYPEGKYFGGYGIFKKRKETFKGIDIIRIPLIPRGTNSITLLLNYLSFVLSGFFWNLFTRIKTDFVFIFEVSPMTQALPGVWYAKKSNIPCFIYVTDLWPENVEIVADIKSKNIIRLLGFMVDYIYRNCNKIFTASESFFEAIAGRGVDQSKIYYWPQYAEDYYKPLNTHEITIPEIPQDGVFNVIFAGNIGFAQGLDILPKSAKMLQSEGIVIRFNLVGDGRYKNNLIKTVVDHDLQYMFNFIEKQAAVKVPELIAVSDVALICLAKSEVFSITLPAKTQSYLACGIPIIVSADGEVQKVIRAAKAGLCSDAGDARGLADNIKIMLNLSQGEMDLFGENALDYYKMNFEKEKLLKQMDIWFQYN